MDCPACSTPVDVRVQVCPQCQQVMGDVRRGAAYFANLALAYAERQRPDRALTAWQIVEMLDPRHPQLSWHRAQAQLEQGQMSQAIASFERVLEQAPQHMAACLALGEIMGQLHRWQEAESYLNRALEADPKSAQAHLALGRILVDQDKLKEAFRHIQQATRLDAHNGAAWLRLGRLYELAGAHAQATHSYRRAAAALPPASIEGQEALRLLETLHPPLPEAMLVSSLELARQMAGPVLICALSALLDAGLRPWWIPWTGWAALALGAAGAFLWVSAASLPRNPLIRQLVGDPGLSSAALRAALGAAGVLCWLAAMVIILLPSDWPGLQMG
jgi:tetratricopeptide (TPR) repeat protein